MTGTWEKAEALLPRLRERAAKCEELRRLPDDTLRDFHDARLFRIHQPKRVGGEELEFAAVVTYGALFARACASTAWNWVNFAAHHMMLGMFPAKAQDEIWGRSVDALIASSFVFPAGKARKVQDGYLLSGRWPFSSGVDPSEWNMLAGLARLDDHLPPEQRIFMVPRAQYKVIDTWFAGGLRGTGSKDVEAAKANAEQTRLQLVFDTENDFLNVLINRELFRVSRSRFARAVEQFEISRARVLSGAAVQTDSLQLVVELTQARIEMLRRELDLRVSRLQLGRRIGETGMVDATVIDSVLPPPITYSDPQLVQLALAQAPQYVEARARERSASSFLTGTRSTYLPSITLTGQYQRFDDHFFPSARSVTSGTIAVSLPIWNLGQREIAVQQAKTNRDVARAFRADLERAAERDVVRAAEAYRIARDAVDLTRLQLEAARETYRVQDLRYKSGANTILDLLEAQFALTRAEAETVQAVYALYLSLAGLEAIVGQRLFPGSPQ